MTEIEAIEQMVKTPRSIDESPSVVNAHWVVIDLAREVGPLKERIAALEKRWEELRNFCVEIELEGDNDE